MPEHLLDAVARHRNDAAFGLAGLSTSSSLSPASLHHDFINA